MSINLKIRIYYTEDIVSKNGNILKIGFQGSFAMSATIELTEKSELSFSISADPDVSFEKINFPPAFQTPDKNHYLVQTDSQGLLLPVDDTFYPLEDNLSSSVAEVRLWLGLELQIWSWKQAHGYF